jgi:hypothetical protein
MTGKPGEAHAGVARGVGTARTPGQRVYEPATGREVTVRYRGATGRPPGLTSIEDDEQLCTTIREMRRDKVKRFYQTTVAARSGFTVAEIRGYLKVTNRTWAEFLRSF